MGDSEVYMYVGSFLMQGQSGQHRKVIRKEERNGEDSDVEHEINGSY